MGYKSEIFKHKMIDSFIGRNTINIKTVRGWITTGFLKHTTILFVLCFELFVFGVYDLKAESSTLTPGSNKSQSHSSSLPGSLGADTPIRTF